MSVHKRGGRWHFTKTIDGVRYRSALKTARTKAQAEEAEIKILNQIHEGTYRRPTQVGTLKDFAEKVYMPWAKDNKKSWKSDRAMLDAILGKFGNKRMSQISSFEVEKYKIERRDSLTVRAKPRSRSSVNKELKLLSKLFRMAKLRYNPCSEVQKLKGETKRRRWLKPEERERLMKVLTGRRAHVRPMVIVCLNLGLRRGELLTLRPENVDFYRDLVVVNGKTGEREVPLNSTARAELKALVETAKSKRWEYLFTNPNTGTRYKHLKHSFTSAMIDAKIEDFRFHDLRHTFGTLAVDRGAPLAGVRDAMGHASLETTNRYAHGTEEGKRRAVEAQEKVIEIISGHKSVTKQKRQAS